MQTNELETDCSVHLCGIEIQLFYDGAVIHSWLIYKPKHQLISTELHLECMVLSVLSDGSSNNSERLNSIIIPPPTQQWFLILYRYWAMPTSENADPYLFMGHTVTLFQGI